MTDEMHGHVTSIAVSYRKATLIADAATGATALVVDDVADLAEEGGSLRVAQADGTFLAAMAYTAIDDDTATIALAAPTTADVFAGAIVRVLDANGKYAADVQAQLVDDNDGLPVTVDVAHSLIPLLTDSMRAGTDESVVATRDEHGTWTVVDVLGKSPVLDAPHGERTRSTTQSVPDSTDTTLLLNSSTVAGRGGLTYLSGTWTVGSDGRHLVTASIAWDTNAAGIRRAWIVRNGSPTGMEARQNAASAGGTSQVLCHAFDCAAGDEIEIHLIQTSGGALDVLASTTVTITGLD